MRVKRGGCRMPIGMCSDYRDKDCGKFCYYNTVEVKSKGDCLRAMSDEGLAEWIETIANCDACPIRGNCRGADWTSHGSCMLKWLGWLKQEANG